MERDATKRVSGEKDTPRSLPGVDIMQVKSVRPFSLAGAQASIVALERCEAQCPICLVINSVDLGDPRLFTSSSLTANDITVRGTWP